MFTSNRNYCFNENNQFQKIVHVLKLVILIYDGVLDTVYEICHQNLPVIFHIHSKDMNLKVHVFNMHQNDGCVLYTTDEDPD
jgi:hypothetical protein